MYSSAIVALALVATAAPAFAAPLYAREDASGALNTGLIKDVVSIGNDVVQGAQGIKQLITYVFCLISCTSILT